MRKPMIAGNWKMFKTRDEALEFVFQVNKALPKAADVDTVICAQAPLLRDLVKRQGEHLRIGAQNLHQEDQGAFTGEVSAMLLKDLQVEYALIGHSERREYYNETNDSVNAKLKQALRYGLNPIVCVGESLATREAGDTDAFVAAQVTAAFKDVQPEDLGAVVIAYEPIWAIGTGVSATDAQANETIAALRKTFASLYGANYADDMRILYGGSVKPETIDGLMAQSDIDGALIGGASLDAKGFITMANAAIKTL